MPQPETQGGWKSWIQLPDGTFKGRPLRNGFHLGTEGHKLKKKLMNETNLPS